MTSIIENRSDFGAARAFPETDEFLLPKLHFIFIVAVDMEEFQAQEIIDYIFEVANGGHPENIHHGLLDGCGISWFIEPHFTEHSSSIKISTPAWAHLPHPMFLTQDRCLTPMHAAWIASLCDDNMSIFRAISILINEIMSIEPIRSRHMSGTICNIETRTRYFVFNSTDIFNGNFWRRIDGNLSRMLPEEHKSDGQDVHLTDQIVMSILDCDVYQRELERVRTWFTQEQRDRIDDIILNNPSTYILHTRTGQEVLRTTNKFIVFRGMLRGEFGEEWVEEFGSRFAYYFMQ